MIGNLILILFLLLSAIVEADSCIVKEGGARPASGPLREDASLFRKVAIPKPFLTTHKGHVFGGDLRIGDLNGDEDPDFMLPFTTGGCGGGAWAHDVVMILSADGRYRVTKISTYGGDWRDYFVRIAGKPCYVHQAFNYESRCKDGKSHSFFIYNLYEIKGDGIRLGNHLHPDFPRIVWFSFKPNNRETDLLSEGQKKILLGKSFPDVQWHGGFVKRTPPERL